MHLVDIEGREAVHLISNLEPKWKPMAEFGKDELLHEMSSIVEAFLAIPAVDPEELRPKGKWDPYDTPEEEDPAWVCSKCGRAMYMAWLFGRQVAAYCPYCGAKMEGDSPEIKGN